MDYPKRYIMKILFFDSPAFAKQDMIDAFEDMNIACDLFFHEEYNDRQSTAFSAAFDVALQEASYDFVFPLIITLSSPPAVSVMESVMFPTSMTAHW